MLSKKVQTTASRFFAIAHWALIFCVYAFLSAKAFLEFSMKGDVLAYHLPHALELFHRTTFEPAANAVNILKGYPLLTFWIQGALIAVTGRMSTVNALNVIGFSLVVLSVFWIHGKNYSYRWFLTFVLGIPLFVLHTFIGYNDLFAACMLLVAFVGLHGLATGKDYLSSFLVLFLGLAAACFSKATAWPTAFCFLLCAFYVLWQKQKNRHISPLHMSLAAFLLSFAVLAFPVRNFLLYQNPTYPWQPPFVSSFFSFPGNKGQGVIQKPNFILQKPAPVQLLYSAFEINRLYSKERYKWSHDQFASLASAHRRMGGWFFLTIAALLAMWIAGLILNHVNRPLSVALLFSLLIFAFTSRSNELRFALFFPLCLIYLLTASMGVFPKAYANLFKGVMFFCAAYVLSSLSIWTIDARTQVEKAPLEAKLFWEENSGNTSTIFKVAKQPLSIFWSGPTFSEIRVKALSTSEVDKSTVHVK